MTIDPLVLADGYYAAHDPDSPGVVTCWRRSTRGSSRTFATWQKGARYGPVARVARADVPTARPERETFRNDLSRIQSAWTDRVVAAIIADPDGARLLFASFTGSCCVCGRKLTDPDSKLSGIGPECRKGLE